MTAATDGGDAGGRASAVTVLLIAVVLAAVVALVSLASRGPAAPPSLQDRTRIVAQGLRCPSCQNLSVADSPSPIAGEIRRDIARRLAAGQSAGAIRGYYVSRYGPWILLSPPKSGVTLVAWILPLLIVVLGLVVAVFAVRRWTIAGVVREPIGPGDGGSEPEGIGGDRLSATDRVLLDRARAGLSTSEEPE